MSSNVPGPHLGTDYYGQNEGCPCKLHRFFEKTCCYRFYPHTRYNLYENKLSGKTVSAIEVKPRL